MLMQIQVGEPSVVQELAACGWGPSMVAIHPHLRWGECELRGPCVRSRHDAKALSPVRLSFTKCPVDCSKLNPHRPSWAGFQQGPQVCHFSLGLVMGYNATCLSRKWPRQQCNLMKIPLLKLGTSRPVLRNTEHCFLPSFMFCKG